MKNQRIILSLGLALAAALFAGCASTKAVSVNAAKPAKEIERVIIDYKGATFGQDVPSWVEAIANDDFEILQSLPSFKDKDRLPVVAVERGQNLDLLKSWANNFSVQAQVARSIENKVSAEFGGNQEGDKNTAESTNFVKELVTTFSKTKVSGLQKEKDYWIKLKTRDNYKKTETEQYEYYVLYSISNEDLQRQIDIALGKIEAKTQVQKELKDEVKDALASLKSSDLSASSF
jgi:hypothetical protein